MFPSVKIFGLTDKLQKFAPTTEPIEIHFLTSSKLHINYFSSAQKKTNEP